MPPKLPRLSTLFEYFLYSIPLYIFVISPLLRTYFPSFSPSLFDFSAASSGGSPSYQSFEKTDALVIPEPNLQCEDFSYKTRILSREPLIIYIENFLSTSEADHLIDVATPLFQPSTIHHGSSETFNPSIRNSSKALLPRDRTVQCLESRARSFQGWRGPDVYIERLWLQKYDEGGHYTYHYDWSGDVRRHGAGRLSTFMVYVGNEGVTGGGTRFPRLARPSGVEWCSVLECSEKEEENDREKAEGPEGVTFKPIKGNAVYWENFRPDGRGYEETWHAGLPVKSGTKYGLNIWSWYQPGYGEAMEKQTQRELAKSSAEIGGDGEA